MRKSMLGVLAATAVAGVATFSNLRISQAGAGYTLTASAAGLTGATSAAFTVTSAHVTADLSVTASVDDADTNKRFAESLHADYPILADPAKTVATAYGVVTATRPVAYRWTFYIGPDGKILYVDKAISTATAGADIARRLGELGVKRRTG